MNTEQLPAINTYLGESGSEVVEGKINEAYRKIEHLEGAPAAPGLTLHNVADAVLDTLSGQGTSGFPVTTDELAGFALTIAEQLAPQSDESGTVPRRIPPVKIDHDNVLPELEAVATNPALRIAIWNVLRSEGFTDEQISFNEQQLGRHTSRCKEGGCRDESGEPLHRILDRYNEVKDIIKATGLLASRPAEFYVGQVIIDEKVLDQLPFGTIIMGARDRFNQDYPELFRNSGSKDRPWMHLDPSDRDDGEATEHSGTVLRWRLDGKAVILFLPRSS